ncbi:MAG: hypothetical protein TUN42_09700 [Dehalogenimonas sp.]
MTVTISPQKVRSILKLYFAGLPQVLISQKTDVNQSTISDYAKFFKQSASAQGLTAAAKEHGIMEEVTALRSLSVELFQENLTAEDAREGADIIKRFKKLGVFPSDHKFLVTVCKSANSPSFTQAVVMLGKLMEQTGLSYSQSVLAYEKSAADLNKTNQQLANATSQLGYKHKQLDELSAQLSAVGAKLTQKMQEAKQQETHMANEMASKMNSKKVKEIDIDEVVALRKLLAGTVLDVATLITIAKEFKK